MICLTKYNNSPIIEAVCEIRFTEDTDWDLTVPGLVFEDISAQYPKKEQRTTQEIRFSPGLSGAKSATGQIKRSDFAVFYKDDRKAFIQIGPRILATSKLKPYKTWDDFKSQISYAFEKLHGRVELKGIQRIGLRYINMINIPIKDGVVEEDNYFEFRPNYGPKLPQVHADFMVSTLFTFHDARDLCKVELSTAMPEVKESMSFRLSIDYFLAEPRSVPVNKSMEWLEDAHTEIETLFEGCILPPLREIFEEVKE